MNEKYTEAMEFIAGSCMIDAQLALDTILKRNATDDEVEEFEQFLIDNECYECERCGWYTHPGEVCDCDDECSECGFPEDECECE